MKPNSITEVIILAGGEGTRLRSVIDKQPKALAPLLGIPILEYQIQQCVKAGLHRINLITFYGHDEIADYIFSQRTRDSEISLHKEACPRGTGGALIDFLQTCPLHLKSSLVILGDIFFDMDIGRLIDFHITNKSDLTIVGHPNNHPHDSDIINADSSGRVSAIYAYPHDANRFYPNLVSAGIYVIDNDVLRKISISAGLTASKLDLTKHIIPILLNQSKEVFVFRTEEYMKDIGTPKRLAQVEKDIGDRKPEKYRKSALKPAIFFDRDGTINQEKSYINTPDDLHLIAGVEESILRLNRSQYLPFCVTNQPIIARGEADEQSLREIHNKLETLLGKASAFIQEILYCPHHPDKGFINERSEYKIVCDCRKPKTGMIKKIVSNYNIDLNNSWLVGDSTTDILTGKNAHIKTILLKTGLAGRDGKYEVIPDFESFDINSAINFILDTYPKAIELSNEVISETSCNLFLIGGLSRSGKSTFAGVLKERLTKVRGRTHLIHLDMWLKERSSRTEDNHIIDRYCIELIQHELIEPLSKGLSFDLQIKTYNRESGVSVVTNKVLNISPKDQIIIEGIPALLLKDLISLQSYKIYVNINEELRQQRIRKDYGQMGYTETSINSILHLREINEAYHVRRSMDNSYKLIHL